MHWRFVVLPFAFCVASCSGDEFVGENGSGGASGGLGGAAGSGSAAGSGGAAGGAATGGSNGCEGWCGSQATCEGDVCVIAAGQNGPEFLVADDLQVYWSAYSRVRRVAKDGSWAPQTLLEDSTNNFEAVALDDTHVFTTNETAGTVMRASKTGGDGTSIVSGLEKPAGLAVDSTHVYFADATAGKVLRVPKAGGQTELFASGQLVPEAVALDSARVYWTAKDGIWACAKGQTCATPVNLGATHPPDSSPQLALSATRVYWTTSNGVAATKVDGSVGVTELVTDTPAEGLFVAADGRVYFCSETANAVYGVSSAGGAKETIATGQPGARSVTVDDQFVYWVTNLATPDGSVRKKKIP